MLQSYIDYESVSTFTSTPAPTTFSIDQQYIIYWSGVATAVVSIAGLAFIFVSYIYLPRLRSFPSLLVLMLSLSIFFGALSCLQIYLWGTMCEVSGWLLTFSGLATVSSVCSIAFTINRVLHSEDNFLQDITKHKTYWIYCWGIPLVMSMLPFSTHSYDTEKKSEDWCWITLDTTTGLIWALLTWYIPVWLMLFYIIRVYWKSAQVLQTIRLDDTIENPPNTQLLTQTSIMVYPPIFFLTASCSCLDTLFKLLFQRHNFYLELLKIISMNLGGFFVAIVFGLTPAVRMEWIACCCPRLDHKDSLFQYRRLADEHRPLDHEDRRLDHEDRHFDDEGQNKIGSVNTATSETYIKASSQSEEYISQIYEDIYKESYRSFTITK